MANILHEGDVGTIFTVYCRDGEDAVDLSSETSKNIVFRKPGGGKETKTAAFDVGVGDGTDGILTYTTIAGDLDTVGEWALQAQVVLSTGARSFTTERFHVHEKL